MAKPRRLGKLAALGLMLIAASVVASATTLTIVSPDEGQTLDPALNTETIGRLVLRNIFDALVDLEGGSITFSPGLATSWTVSDDGLRYEFTLREGVSFHDGTPFNAEAAKYSLERIVALKSEAATLISSLQTVEVLGPYSLRITLTRVDITFLDGLYWAMIVSPTAYSAHATTDDPWARQWATANPVGTGPYKFVERIAGDRTVLSRNAKYWREWQSDSIDEVIVRVVPEASTRALLMEQGVADVAVISLPTDVLTGLAKKPGITLHKSATAQQVYIGFNCQQGLTANPMIRQAIAFAFPDALMVDAMGGLAEIANGPIPEVIVGEFPREMLVYNHDLERAKALLAAAGHPGGGFSLDYVYFNGIPEEELAGLLLQSELRKLGIELKMTGVVWATMKSMFAAPDTSPALWGHQGYNTTVEAYGMLNSFFRSSNVITNGGRNYGFYSNSTVDQLLDRIVSTLDAQERQLLYSDLLVVLSLDCPRLGANVTVEAVPMRNWVRGYEYNAVRRYGWSFYELHGTKE
jgi:peptide/nickel transport system substrate-binding protein